MSAFRRLMVSSVLSISAWLAPAVIRLRRPLLGDASEIIHVIGDSHVSLFSGRDAMVDAWPRSSKNTHERFRAYRLGPVLAYRLPDLQTTSRGRERLLTVLAFGPIRRAATVMLSFGEIDCRYHLPRQVEVSGRPMPDVVAECVDRYARVVREVRGMGFLTLVWGVVPSLEQSADDGDPEYPHWGSAKERHEITQTFNRMLSERLAGDGVPVVSVFDQLMSADGLSLDSRYYLDAVHLSTAALPLACEAVDKALGL